MYQSVIKDPGGDSFVRIQPNVCDRYSAIVNGSILIVPPGTTAFVAVNGVLSKPYRPGRYEIFTGIDPFFVRLRNILTRGDTGTSVSVFFVSTEKAKFIKLGTGEMPFREHRFQLTMKALASCSLSISISDPLRFLAKLVGSYSSSFSEEDIDPCIEQMVLAPIREAISTEISKLNITEFNSKLAYIGNMAAGRIRSGLSEYGVKAERFTLTAINVPASEMERLYSYEGKYAEGKTKTDLELDNLTRIWNGNINNRTFAEMMTGVPRGQTPAGGAGGNPGWNAGGMAPLMQIAMLSQIIPTLQDQLNNMTRHTDMFNGASSDAQSRTSTAESPPPIPNRYKRCPACNGNVLRRNNICPICGYQF